MAGERQAGPDLPGRGPSGRVTQGGKPEPVEELLPDPVDHRVRDRCAVAGRIDNHAERTLPERGVHDAGHGTRDVGRVGVVWHAAGERRLHAVREVLGQLPV